MIIKYKVSDLAKDMGLASSYTSKYSPGRFSSTREYW